MPQFTDFISDALVRQGYKLLGKSDGDVFLLEPEIYRTTLEGKSIWICYLDREVTPEQIRRMFDFFKGYVLVVVNEKLIPDNVASRQQTPMWLRVLHGLYMGRIYAWNGRSVFGLHIDYDTGDVSESPALQPTSLLLIETGTWLRGWPGEYKLARFYDRAWWNTSAYEAQQQREQHNAYEQAKRKQSSEDFRRNYQGTWDKGDSGYQSAGYQDYKQQSSSRQSYEQARDSYWSQQQAREKAQRTRYDSSGWAYDPNDWPNGKPPDPPRKEPMRDFGKEFRACNNKAEAKALYKKLAREFHPDFNMDNRTVEDTERLTIIMQQINVAYAYVEGWWD